MSDLNWSGWLSLAGPIGIAFALMIAGLLSKRLGSVTRTAPYYGWFYVAAGLVAVSIVARMIDLGRIMQTDASRDLLRMVLYSGLPALAVTIGVIVAWRYWSWLLAERD